MPERMACARLLHIVPGALPRRDPAGADEHQQAEGNVQEAQLVIRFLLLLTVCGAKVRQCTNCSGS